MLPQTLFGRGVNTGVRFSRSCVIPRKASFREKLRFPRKLVTTLPDWGSCGWGEGRKGSAGKVGREGIDDGLDRVVAPLF
jgi:hypothetical protein